MSEHLLEADRKLLTACIGAKKADSLQNIWHTNGGEIYLEVETV
jgi:hypothetical protein